MIGRRVATVANRSERLLGWVVPDRALRLSARDEAWRWVLAEARKHPVRVDPAVASVTCPTLCDTDKPRNPLGMKRTFAGGGDAAPEW